MKHDREKLWSAYLDDQLDAKESAEFDDSLSLDEKDRLTKEVRWESCLANVLVGDSDCPDAVWKRVRSKVLKKGREGQSARPLRFVRHLWKAAAIAASVLVAFSLLYRAKTSGHDDCLSMPLNIEAMTVRLDVSGDLDSVRRFLKERDIDIYLRPVSAIQMPNGHKAILLGALESQVDGETVVELLYDCCGKPMKMVLARNGTVTAERIRSSMSEDIVQAIRQVGDFQIALVGLHGANSLMQLLVKT